MKRKEDDTLRTWFLLVIGVMLILLACMGAVLGLVELWQPLEWWEPEPTHREPGQVPVRK